MKKLILDTNFLIEHWRRRYARPRKRHHVKDAERWAKELIKEWDTNAIVTPVYIEMVGGTLSPHEARLTRAFLEQFECVDMQDIKPRVWKHAIHSASNPLPRARDLGDCLIGAIAVGLGYEVKTHDTGFPS